MGGFTINGIGAKDYFKKMKYLGEHDCPYCGQRAPMQLEKSTFRISIIYIPTIPLKKEAYSIMCQKCKQGRMIPESAMHQLMLLEDPHNHTRALLKGAAENIIEAVASAPAQKQRVCPSCGHSGDGLFCGHCGARMDAALPEPIPVEPTAPETRCPTCGSILEDGVPCPLCSGHQAKAASIPAPVTEPAPKPAAGETWECFLCGTANSIHSGSCSLCGQKREF